ncbi:LacI family DNA-binding transcriptional regulator [Aquisalimonas asiatica]|uniref:Transcriptional regulator, LacI family n=1 Tax=Aquisalimonas asiatica TaxID=406100 RepID=A0A1H8Q108_9GAMM|nr:LacI family DNA-binding transcriptional regulator [Aquisalimonas asiatica]SEO47681.1 transcriptional regulator, LacI family [Aquisalimonas asiatica]
MANRRSGRVNARDVARAAGVSQSAVSRTFTPGASIAAETRQRVIAAARELGYRPNAFARSLITRRSRMVGLVLADLDNPFYARMLEAVSRELQAAGHHVMLFFTDRGEADDALQEILQYPVAGLLMASATLSSALARECAEAGIPVVLVNRDVPDAPTVSVTADNEAGGAAVGDFLARAGHQRVAFIAGDPEASTSRDREHGFREALARHGLTCHARAVGNYTREGAREAARTLFRVNAPPDAVFVANDYMAFAVMDTLRGELGLRVPEDVSVVGYDDVTQAAWGAYNLTTVTQPTDTMVSTAVTALLDSIRDGAPGRERRVIAGELVVRRSSRCPQNR